MRKLALVVSLAMAIGAIAAPALATKPDLGSDLVSGHKIWICHTTRSLSNPYVKILIDIEAWDIVDPDSDDHGPQHHERTKDGITWADYALENPEDPCVIDPPVDPPTRLVCPVTEDPADYVVSFGAKMWTTGQTSQTVSAEIAAGTYDVTLISGDSDRSDGDDPAPVQPNESWRLLGTNPSGYSTDLADAPDPITGQPTIDLEVTFGSDVSSATAEHYSVGTADTSNQNSVIAEYACLLRTLPGG